MLSMSSVCKHAICAVQSHISLQFIASIVGDRGGAEMGGWLTV